MYSTSRNITTTYINHLYKSINYVIYVFKHKIRKSDKYYHFHLYRFNSVCNISNCQNPRLCLCACVCSCVHVCCVRD